MFFFFVFWRSKGRGAMPQGHENKGNKTIRQKEKQKARVTYRVKRPPKWEGAPPYGASPPTSPGNRTAVGACKTGKIITTKLCTEAHVPTLRYGHYLTHAHNHITRAVAA